MKILIDMNLTSRWVPVLAEAGFQAIHWSTIGPADAPDSQIMTYAVANDYVVLTQDMNFSAILAATNAQKPSVIQIRAEDTSPEVISHQILAAIHHITQELSNGVLVTVDPKRIRLRVLPLNFKKTTDR